MLTPRTKDLELFPEDRARRRARLNGRAIYILRRRINRTFWHLRIPRRPFDKQRALTTKVESDLRSALS